MKNYSIVAAVSSTIQALETGQEIYTQVANALILIIGFRRSCSGSISLKRHTMP